MSNPIVSFRRNPDNAWKPLAVRADQAKARQTVRSASGGAWAPRKLLHRLVGATRSDSRLVTLLEAHAPDVLSAIRDAQRAPNAAAYSAAFARFNDTASTVLDQFERGQRTTRATLPGSQPDATYTQWHHAKRCSPAAALSDRRSTSPPRLRSATYSVARAAMKSGPRSKTRSWCSGRLDPARACTSSSTRSSTPPARSSQLPPGPTTSPPLSPPAEPGDRSLSSTPSGSPRACRLGCGGRLSVDARTRSPR